MLLDRRGLNIAPCRTIGAHQRKGIGHDPVDPAAGEGFRADHAQRQLVLHQRDVEHEIVGVIETAALGARQDALRGALVVHQIGLIGDQPDRAAHRARAVERALRPAQHLDPVQIIERRVDHDLAVLRAGRGGHRNVVEIETDRCGIAAARRHAAHLDLGLAGPFGLHRDAGRVPGQRGEIADAAILQIFAGDRRDADRRLLYRGRPLLCSNDDFFATGDRSAGNRRRLSMCIERKGYCRSAQQGGQSPVLT
ncbi:MAG: hypothetical protein WDN69_30910 [Aliidongia sp.]